MSDPTQREEAIFNAALQLPAGERAAFLQDTCAGDTELLARVGDLLRAMGQTVGPEGTRVVSFPLTEKPGDKIGRYKLLEQIGEGGFGVVYVAEQEQPVRRRVALKVIKMGMDTKQVIARFEAERQALALMDHPNIAKVLDAGATETGRPYFVMELVKGERITNYCDKNNLSTRQRLDLFVQICHAIQHAHQKGIIHRDIKPSNILVTMHDGKPVPKVIDFGIAKATEQRLTDKTVYTALEQMIGTPAYMSPEQAEMSGIDIDTRSDIYSLGVLLYELLTGKTPFDPKELVASGLEAMRRTIREKEPQRPSTRLTTMVESELTATAKRRQTDPPKLVHSVRGDLDWIAMKCLEKDRTRRYETATGVAADILRHINNEAVLARPPSQLYRFQKLVQRNKLVFAAAGAIATALAVGVAMSVWGLVKEHQSRLAAEANEQKAEAEAAKSRQVAQFLKDMLNGVGPSVALGRDTALLREILDNTAKRVGTDLGKQPEVEAELRYTLGDVYWEVGDLPRSEDMHRKALDIRRNLFGNNSVEVAQSLEGLGRVLGRQGKLDQAAGKISEAVAIERKTFGPDSLEVARTLNELSGVYNQQRALPQAEEALRQALTMQKKRLGNENLDAAETLGNLAAILYREGKLSEAESDVSEAIAVRTKLAGPESPEMAGLLNILARTLEIQRRNQEAEPVFRRVLAMRQKLLLADHPDIAQSLMNLAKCVWQAHPEEAETLARQSLEMRKKLLAPESQELLLAYWILGGIYECHHKWAEAEMVWREAVVLLKTAPESTMAELLYLLGLDLEIQKKWSEAESAFREAIIMRQKVEGIKADTGDSFYHLGYILAAQHKLVEAREALAQAVDHGTRKVQLDVAMLYLGNNSVARLDESARVAEHIVIRSYVGSDLLDLHDTTEAIRILRNLAKNGDLEAQVRLGLVYENGTGIKRDPAEAAKWFAKAAEINDAAALNDVAWRLATAPDSADRNGPAAVALAEKAVAQTNRKDYNKIDTLAAAYAEDGRFDQAIATEKDAINLMHGKASETEFASHLKLFETHAPYREK